MRTASLRTASLRTASLSRASMRSISMRCVSVHVAVLCSLAVALSGQTPISLANKGMPSMETGSMGMASMGATPLGTVPRAEDSPEAAVDNQIFYGTPRPQVPQVSQPAGTVSVEQLQHPVSRKGDGLLRQARTFAAKGDHPKAIAKLQLALKEPSAIPYANSMLGTEYLRTNQVPAAIKSLEQAIKLLPRSAVDHANLGFALFLSGLAERAEQEVRKALELDHTLHQNDEKTRRVLSLILHARDGAQ
jgi:tetratricopeptide (TPR) repeat protein